jgi:hypothetical protein
VKVVEDVVVVETRSRAKLLSSRKCQSGLNLPRGSVGASPSQTLPTFNNTLALVAQREFAHPSRGLL